MKLLLLNLLIIATCTSCMVNYPTTTFYEKNNSDKVINFKASIMKYSSMGQFEMTLPFTVLPQSVILVRQTGFRKDAAPTAWFTRFTIFPTDSISFNDPYNSVNWVRSSDQSGKPIYIFTLVK